jgi:hypothetical protein
VRHAAGTSAERLRGYGPAHTANNPTCCARRVGSRRVSHARTEAIYKSAIRSARPGDGERPGREAQLFLPIVTVKLGPISYGIIAAMRKCGIRVSARHRRFTAARLQGRRVR